jgi:hypothetical protein
VYHTIILYRSKSRLSSPTCNANWSNYSKASNNCYLIAFHNIRGLQFVLFATHPYSNVSSSWNTKHLTSILSLPSFSSVPGMLKAVCGTRRARPSSLESKHLIKMTSSGPSPDL